MFRRMIILASTFLVASWSVAQTPVNRIHIKPTLEYNLAGNDMSRLKILADGVGWEFEPNEQTNQGLKKIGIKRIRCINVDPVAGTFDEKGNFHVDTHANGYLHSQLATCRAVGADPHFIIATGLHPDLVLQEKDFKTNDKNLLGMVHSAVFGPTDWLKFHNYCKAVFHYILIDQKFPNACFEVGNEPDGGGFFVAKPPKPAPGSRAGYEAYFKMYKAVANAAVAFEKGTPGTKVVLGGPAVTWVFTFKFGDFNWTERFLRDVRTARVKLDFIGLHFYGNLSPLTGDSDGVYPSYEQMMAQTRDWRDKYTPDVPIWFTEWGASYHTSLTPESLHNGNHIGAAWSAAFLNQMLMEGVEKALYLVTTDIRQEIDGQWKDIWGWPSFFTNSTVTGVYPKAPYHVFQMVSRMGDQRVEATRPGGTLGAIAARGENSRLTVMVWNNSFHITESGPGSEKGRDEKVMIQILDVNKFFKGPVRVTRYLVSKDASNAYGLFEKGEKIDERADLQKVEESTLEPTEDTLYYNIVQPPSSVSFIEISPASGAQTSAVVPK